MKYLFSLLLGAAAACGSAFAQTWSNLVPLPAEIRAEKGQFIVGKGFQIFTDPAAEAAARYLAEDRLPHLLEFTVPVRPENGTETVPGSLAFQTVKDLGPEAYRLTVRPERITIEASAPAGHYYAVQTLLQMFPASVYSDGNARLKKAVLDCVQITDEPRYAYRGLMLDVSRTFYDAGQVKQLLDWMAAHKLNRFHWHLSDDNGWRIEIRKYPDLTRKGAWRGEGEVTPPAYSQGSGRYGGYYTQKEIRDIVRYAQERHIEIIPEIDLPGHSRSFVGTLPEIACESDAEFISVNGETDNVLCVAREANYRILDRIIGEIADLFPSEYIHIGGDEVDPTSWSHCPRCRALMEEKGLENPKLLLNVFVGRMEKILTAHGKKLAGWDEIVEGDTHAPGTLVYAWQSVKRGNASLEKGYRTVMQIGEYSYYDMKQSPRERGHNWAGIVPLEKAYAIDPDSLFRPDPETRERIAGVQAGLWTELMAYPPRFMEYQLFPRVCALAEAGWTPAARRNFSDFEERLYQAHFSRMNAMGIAFRVAPPSVRYEQGVLLAVPPHANAVVRYSDNGQAPTPSSPVYRAAIATRHPEDFRFATFFGDGLSSISVGAENVTLYHYQTPDVQIETDIPFRQPGTEGITTYDFSKWARTARQLREGDRLTYRFSAPVSAHRITVETGMPNITFYGVSEGYVEYSEDGEHFTKAGDLEYGILSFVPETEVRAVRICVTGANDSYMAAFQNLRIE